MPEEITFTAPAQTDPGAVRFRIAKLLLDWEHATIAITLREWSAGGFDGPRRIEASYDGAVATTLMQQLNKLNLSTRSLHQRILDRLLADGKIPGGAVAGTVD